MQKHAEKSRKLVPNPRGTQTIPQAKPVTPRLPDGRFAPPFHPHPIPKNP